MTTLASAPVLVDIRVEMNDHWTMTVELHETKETRHLVAYESTRIRNTLASLPVGARVPIEMVRAGSRSNVWKAVALHGRRVSPPDSSATTAN
ncbi:hypothetical protein E6P09_12090 [Haloferax mediterranei ATCC 33500]|uniref:DUF7999 domain-containing protein n=1 Tax=Haloferax mediterranei (strain ATCC 33500 / DSM 1411 / JCM 8866 / NBRC 14739 / NCIMB 2177 / R-4) TaxID=523841 RepID=I3R5K7_HALMT|nr:hypothetical protein [Haloferax mediterranei]AFK19517.1 hypothetical protein HFX_1813 [Haloferax mediterranei ATCC 33500]AHZ21142.1 hypothetical protein BM92_00035 [Haloferax mediterranei ATCC 33500]EMA04296.1 hypothetical protein C439_01437 [Haloferax mediterranei ATCC 33500]MDX5989620.1 hypothetical protein [Haloferax mediterranei ATCC 33500]QCQ75974.1 hypothetical protein E6P09_12090 [Haloferax mediterranei ATCC 33500]